MSKFLTIVLLFTALNAYANVFGKDDRKAVKIEPGQPLARIGRITKQADGSRGTAFLIGRCHVLTNLHAAFTNQSKPDMNEALLFEMGNEAPVIAKPVDHGPMVESDSAFNADDWALLKLETCLGEKYGWFEIATPALFAASRKPIVMAGYPSDKFVNEVWVDFDCRIYADKESIVPSGAWKHDCASRGGSSGSPLLVADGDDYVVIALHVASKRPFDEVIRYYDPYVANGAVPMSAILPHIQERKNSEGF